MDRRTYIQSAGVAGIASTAGCLGGVLDGAPEDENGNGDDGNRESRAEGAVLSPPEETRGDPIHPSYGDEVPSFSVADPLSGETVTDDQFRGERAFLMTFVYTSCPDGVCPALLQYLLAGQRDAAENGYADDVAFIAITFDPETDTADALEAQANEVGIDLDAGNFHFLRPESNDAASELVREKFGVIYEIHDDHDDHGGDGEGTAGAGDGGDGTGDTPTETHYDLALLVNEDGIVERSYPRLVTMDGTDADEVLDDLRTVVEG